MRQGGSDGGTDKTNIVVQTYLIDDVSSTLPGHSQYNIGEIKMYKVAYLPQYNIMSLQL